MSRDHMNKLYDLSIVTEIQFVPFVSRNEKIKSRTQKISWAVGSFVPFKFPRSDGIMPVLLQEGLRHIL